MINLKPNGDFWKKGISLEMKLERKSKTAKTALGLVMGGLLLTSSMVTFVGCSNANATNAVNTLDKVKPILDEAFSEWEYKAFKSVIDRLEMQYGLNPQNITEQDLKDTIQVAQSLKVKVESEISLKDNQDYYNTVFHSTEVIEKIKHDNIPANYNDSRQNIYDLAALFGIEHKPNKEKAEAEAARLKAEQEAQQQQQQSSSSSSNKSSSKNSSSKSSGSKKSSSGGSSKSSGSKSSSSGSKSSGGNSSSSGSKSSGGRKNSMKDSEFNGPSEDRKGLIDYLNK